MSTGLVAISPHPEHAMTTHVPPDLAARLVALRHDLHAFPELAFEETRTADVVARELAALGLKVTTGLAGTGVVGTLHRGGGPAIGLRADMDALPILEASGVAYASRTPGTMHACGHDGHVAMLLGAAHLLAADRDFTGTVHFIFQPAEECAGGGRRMVEDGLFTAFPCKSVWGLHNWPGLPLGTLATRPGPIMASMDTFEIRVRGAGTHAAMPHLGIDPCTAAAETVLALQTIVSRRLSPLAPAVVSVTQMHGGDAWNVVPDLVTLRGTVRCLGETERRTIADLMARMVPGIAASHGAQAELDYFEGYPATVNWADAVPVALAAGAHVPAITRRVGDVEPSMAAEDFAYMLQACPGAYVWLGVDGTRPSKPLHNPAYDFNDDALAIGPAYWAALARQALAA